MESKPTLFLLFIIIVIVIAYVSMGKDNKDKKEHKVEPLYKPDEGTDAAPDAIEN